MTIETFKIRIIIVIVLFIVGLICYAISQRPALSKKEEKELRELDNELARLYGGK